MALIIAGTAEKSVNAVIEAVGAALTGNGGNFLCRQISVAGEVSKAQDRTTPWVLVARGSHQLRHAVDQRLRP